MMFLDTGFIKALIDSKDPYHYTAVKIKSILAVLQKRLINK